MKLRDDEFARTFTKIAVAQLCKSQGFEAFQQSALDTLSDVAVKYVWNIGKVAHDRANFANRSECNVFDAFQGIEDMVSVQGFTGASNVDHRHGNCDFMSEIVQCVTESGEVPCAYSIPKFPVSKDRILQPSFLQSGGESPEKSVPTWLPRYPDSDTYIPKTKGKERRQCEGFLDALVSYADERPSIVEVADMKVKQVAVKSSLYLAADRPSADKQVSSVVPPARHSNKLTGESLRVGNHFEDNIDSVLKTHSSSIEAMRNSDYKSDAGITKGLLNARPKVKFKIWSKKRFIGRILKLNPQSEKPGFCFETEDERDDKKRRA